MNARPWIRTRVRQALVTILILGSYLCTGAAWKVWMTLRHPPTDGAVADAIRQELRPYRGLPVAYALGPSFGQLAAALRLAADETSNRRASAREAARLSRAVAQSGSRWSDLAAYINATLEAAPDLIESRFPAPVRTLLIRIDDQRWGRSTEPISPFLRQAAQEYRSIVRDHARSPIAFDALLRLAADEDDSWDFAAAGVDRLTARLLDPGRNVADNRLPGQPVGDDPAAHNVASLYADYLLAEPSRRTEILPELLVRARDHHDTALAHALTAESAPSSRDGAAPRPSTRDPSPPRLPENETVRVFRDGDPVPGVHAALVDPGRLHSLGDAARFFGSGAPTSATLPRGEMMQTLQQLNPVRPDDPLQSSGVVLISSLLASQVVKRLPVAQTGRNGAAFFGQDVGGAVGVALLMDGPAGEADTSLAAGNAGDIRLAPRVKLERPVLSGREPPILRWRPYPGAVTYSAVISMESPAPPGGRSVAVGADWDRHVTWWRDGISGTSIQLDPGGFVGPADSLAGNGLWSRAIYRVIVTAEDASGRLLSSSLGLNDHPEEFFTPPANWLALTGPGARAAARAQDLELPGFGRARRALLRLRRRPGAAPSPVRAAPHTDPLEQVIEIARSLHPTALPGVSVTEPDLAPVDPHAPEAVPLALWPALPTGGRGKIPLSSPFLGGLLTAAFGNG